MNRRVLNLTDQSRSDRPAALAGGVESSSVLPASNSISWKSMTAREIARNPDVDVDPATVRRWPDRGCPVVRRGGRGPGRGTLFDLEQVIEWRARRWRGKAEKTGPVGMIPQEILRVVAAAMLDSLDNNWPVRVMGCERENAAYALYLAFHGCCKAFNYRFALDGQPEAIRALERVCLK